MGKGFSLSVFLLFILPLAALPEGTRQITPFYSAEGKLCIDKSRNDFGFFNAPAEFRINISIAASSEKICLGFGRITNPEFPVDVDFRIKDPAGNIVFGPLEVPRTGPGFISTYDKAVAGPFILSGGYDPYQITTLIPGDYSLEFFYAPDQLGYYTESGRIEFEFFDITVVSEAGLPIPGRVWSKAWQFNCGPVMEPPTTSTFWAKMFILSDDSIVTCVNCNGFVGGTFSISSNQTGCSTTGDVTIDRQSRTGFHTYPQYKVFLNDPDSLIYPTGKMQSGFLLPITTENDCATGSSVIGLRVTQNGLVEVFIEVDPNPGADPRDVKITANVLANPGGNGYNRITWNGNDGGGNPLPNGTTVSATIRFIHGITHLPMYDIEYNNRGYKVEVIRPPGPIPDIYWDDSLLPYGMSVNLIGCSDIAGCHLWSIEVGDTSTLNSWWYVASSTAPVVTLIVKRNPGPLGEISGDPIFCNGVISKTYSVNPGTNATAYIWNYSGAGATISANGTTATIDFTASATSGSLSVSGYNPECGNGSASLLQVTFFPPPMVDLVVPDTLCNNEAAFQLTGGSPSGGEYYINGLIETDFDPARYDTGNYQMLYMYTDEHGCKNSDSAAVFVRGGAACEIAIWVPGAFTPNADGLNDIFRVVSANIKELSMYIYERSGQLVFTATQPFEGWDGSFAGQTCPPGNYVYVIVYESSHSPPKYTTLTGNIMLVR